MHEHARLRGFLHSRARRLSTNWPQMRPPSRTRSGYNFGMNTAVSIPDEIFEKVERLARRAGRSRSEVFSVALAEYLARHAPDEVTDAMNRVIADVGDQQDA